MMDQVLSETTSTSSLNAAATVAVQPLDGYQNTLLMTWQKIIHPPDVRTAFEAICGKLKSGSGPVYVVVDLLCDPKFPLSETMMSAVNCYANPLLGAWLIVGGNRSARAIESFLARVTRRQNVFWFETLEEALSYRVGLDAETDAHRSP